jgi:hypothetical protein
MAESTHPDKDLSSKIAWMSQFNNLVPDINRDGKIDVKDQNIACAWTCKHILEVAGFSSGDRYDTAIYDTQKHLVKAPKFAEAIVHLHSSFDADMPFLIGVNRQFGNVGNSNLATEHFVIMIGRIYDSSTGHYIYRFADVGTNHKDKGMSLLNKLEYNPNNGLIQGHSAYCPNVVYTLTEVRGVGRTA